MKITGLQIENFKRLSAVSITPDGNLVQLTGTNDQGKSSILDGIWAAVAGAGVLPKTPLRKGATEGFIKVDLGEFKITRSFKRRDPTEKDPSDWTTKITVEGKDGAHFGTPQRLLDTFYAAIGFDPMEFARADAKTQFNMLRQFVPGVDFDAIENAQRGDFARRAEANRKASDARGAAAIINVAADTPLETIDDRAIADQMASASDFNTAIERDETRRNDLKRLALAKIGEGENLNREADTVMARAQEESMRILREGEEKAKSLQNQAVARAKESIEIRDQLDAMPPLEEKRDTVKLRADLDAALKTNSRVAEALRRANYLQEAEGHEATAAKIDADMKAREKAKKEQIAAAKFPIDGIGFGEGEVLLNGVSFSEASTANKIRVSCAIAMSTNAKLKVVIIRDGSALDHKSLEVIAEMANEKDYQVWMERVDESGAVGFVIEDGHLKVQPQAIEAGPLATKDEEREPTLV